MVNLKKKIKEEILSIPELILLSCISGVLVFIVIGSFVDKNKKDQVKEDTIVELLGYKYFRVDGIDYETSLITSIDYNTDFSNNNFVITYDDGKAIIRFRADEFTSHN